MKFIIHFTVNGEDDQVIVEGDTIEQISMLAEAELEKRGGLNPWSEEI